MLGLGKVRGNAKRNSSLSEQKIDTYFLILLLERKIQGGVFTVLFMKQIEFFSDNSEMRLPVRAAPGPAACSMASMGVLANMHSSTWAE